MARRRAAGARYPCGKLRPQKQEEWQPYRREYLVVNRVHDGRRYHVSMKSEGASALDRLLFRKVISDRQHEAAGDLQMAWERYRKLFLGMPRPLSRASWGELGFGFPHDERVDPQAASQFYAAMGLLQRQGPIIARAVSDVVLFDDDPTDRQKPFLCCGLNTLVSHFRR